MLVYSAADFEDFREPRPELPPEMEAELEGVVRILVQNRWPWRLHATYDETISRALDAYERVNRDMPLEGLHWFFDHAETISERSMDRIAALGGGIAVQHRMAYQGEYFVERYGARAAEATPPIARMLEKGLKVAAGTDATRVASHNPWVSLAWLVTGRTVGGLRIYPQRNCVDRETALRLWTENATWFSNEEGKKGRIEAGQLADLIVPDRDYFAVPRERDCRHRLGADGRRRPDRLCRGHLREPRHPAAAGDAGLVAGAPLWRERRLGRARPRHRLPRPRPRPRPRLGRHRAGRRPQELLGRARLLVLRVLKVIRSRHV